MADYQNGKMAACVEIDTMLAHLIAEVNVHHSVEHCNHLGLSEQLQLMMDSIQHLHEKVAMIYQREARTGLN